MAATKRQAAGLTNAIPRATLNDEELVSCFFLVCCEFSCMCCIEKMILWVKELTMKLYIMMIYTYFVSLV